MDNGNSGQSYRDHVPPPPDSVSLSCCLLEPSFRSSGVTIFVKHDTEIELCVGISLVRCFFKPVSSFRRIDFTTFSIEAPPGVRGGASRSLWGVGPDSV